MADRPIGVTIIAILQLIGAIAFLALGALSVMNGMAIPLLGIILMAFGAFMVIWGIIGLILFWGLFAMKGWAWLITLLFNIIGLVTGIFGFYNSAFTDFTQLVNVIIPLIIVIYLFFVRDAFK
ncbi:MAG: hypothetical protein ACFFCF_00825 [Promethearchaeota archaeon]